MRRIAVLGSTGSIGAQALDVIDSTPGFVAASLAARSDADGVIAQARRHGVERIAMADPAAAARVREAIPEAEVLDGPEGVVALATDDVDVVLNAVLGAAGLRATLAALDAGHHVALANKESCVAAGPLIRRRVDEGTGVLVPVDSEHASVHMCLRGADLAEVDRVILTASGGPFRGRRRSELETVGIDEALAHPTWSMGAKITVDSATLMNKGLEVIEAHVLFGMPFDRIEVVVHPQSVLHCLVGFADGSWLSALGPPDMRVPIAYALGYPARPGWGAEAVDWTRIGPLTFEPPDLDAFPALRLAYEAGRTGGTVPAVLNAANEVAVEAFLDGRIGFMGIAAVVEEVLEATGAGTEPRDLEDVLAADARARELAWEAVSRRG